MYDIEFELYISITVTLVSNGGRRPNSHTYHSHHLLTRSLTTVSVSLLTWTNTSSILRVRSLHSEARSSF
ncbi:hypothetical protein VNO80_05769 [Phaseolus coccineus]|uniref:Uncharacterized protein n=1 Tax=Phaseolus coccineus TaxID=3886 RepID=A0AAN9NG95_PHACN